MFSFFYAYLKPQIDSRSTKHTNKYTQAYTHTPHTYTQTHTTLKCYPSLLN